MKELTTLARWEGLVFLIALALVILLKALFGTISMRGLLTADRSDGASYFSVGRAQLLVSTLFVSVNYLRQLSLEGQPALPNMATGTVMFLSASQLFYLVGKARALLFFSQKPS